MTSPTLISSAPGEPLQVARPAAIPSLRSNFVWTFSGTVIYAACQWGMLSVLAKFGTPAIVGELTLGLAIGAPVFMFTNLQLRAVQATDVRGESAFADYFTLRLLATLAGLIVIVGLLPFAAATNSVRIVIFLVALSKCVECMSDVIAGLLQREEKLKWVAISLMIRGVGSVAAFALVFALSRNLPASLLAMTGIWLAVLVFYDLRMVRRSISPTSGIFQLVVPEIKRLVWLSLPLGWIATLQSLGVNIPRYFLQHHFGLPDQGMYASLAYIVVVINLIVYALSQSATTRLACMFAEGRRTQFIQLLTKLTCLGILVGLAGVPLSLICGRSLLTLLYRREYGDHVGLLALLVATAAMNTIGSFLFCGVTAAREFHAQLPVNFCAIVVVLIGSAVLIPRWGLIGAGAAVMLSSTLVALGGVWVIRNVMTGCKEHAAKCA